jgi:hypothetical protein
MAERAALAALTPATGEDVKAAQDAVAAAERIRAAECGNGEAKHRGPNCRARESEEQTRRTALAAAIAGKTATDKAAKLERQAEVIRARWPRSSRGRGHGDAGARARGPRRSEPCRAAWSLAATPQGGRKGQDQREWQRQELRARPRLSRRRRALEHQGLDEQLPRLVRREERRTSEPHGVLGRDREALWHAWNQDRGRRRSARVLPGCDAQSRGSEQPSRRSLSWLAALYTWWSYCSARKKASRRGTETPCACCIAVRGRGGAHTLPRAR